MIPFDHLTEKLEEIRNHAFYQPYLAELRQAFSEHQGTPIPALDYGSFKQFWISGSRKEYESTYFQRRKRLSQAFLLCLLYDEKAYREELCEILWAICGEISWALPAHLARTSAAGYRDYLDLFAAETGQSLAEILYFCEDKLPADLCELIRSELSARIFDAYESRTHFWETLVSNWPGVCAGSIGMAYLYAAPERFDRVKDRIKGDLDNFLKSYGEDGSNTEGIVYWRYGFWIYLNFADLLYRFTDGKEDMRHSEKLDKIAAFLPKMGLRRNTVISFSDGARSYAYTDIGLYSYLRRCYGVTVTTEKPETIHIAATSKSSWLLRNFLWSDPADFTGAEKTDEAMQYLEDAEWYIARRKQYAFAAKAGNNCEGHNHNDVGSFILATDEGQILADLGAMEYTAKSFSSERYTILSNSSLGHSVPILDGKEQLAGGDRRGTVLRVTDDEFSMELQGAYPEGAPQVVRTFRLLPQGITLTDEYPGLAGHTAVERFISVIEPAAQEDAVTIGSVRLCSRTAPQITKKTLKNPRAEDEPVWLIDYPVTEGRFVLTAEVEA